MMRLGCNLSIDEQVLFLKKAQKEKSEDKKKKPNGFACLHPDTVDVYVGRLIDTQVHIYVDDLFE